MKKQTIYSRIVSLHTFVFFTVSVLSFGAMGVPFTLMAQVMQSTNFELESDSINIGGARSVSNNFGLEDTVGEVGSGPQDSASFQTDSGFQQSELGIEEQSGGSSGSSLIGQSTELISSISIVPSDSFVFLEFETKTQTVFELRYGLTDLYELGLVTDTTESSIHNVVIERLDTDTEYQYELTVTNQNGAQQVRKGSFQTVSGNVGVLNVTELTAFVDFSDDRGEGVLLEWKKPFMPVIDRIEVNYSSDFFPQNPAEGEVVYSGTGTQFFHSVDVSSSDVHYYTVFVYGDDERVSSGAVTFAIQLETLDAFSVQDIAVDRVVGPGEFSDTPVPLSFGFSDVIFEQLGSRIDHTDEEVWLRGDVPFTVKVPYELVPEVLKTIVVTLESRDQVGTTKYFSFLLSVDESKEFYLARVAPLGAAGVYPVTLTIYNVENGTISRIDSTIRSEYRSIVDAETKPTKSMIWNQYWLILVPMSIVLCFLLFLLFKKRRRKSLNTTHKDQK